MSRACGECLRRAWLVAELAEHIAHARERFGSLDSLLALDDHELVAALGGRHADAVTAAWLRFDPERARRRLRETRLAAICRHDADRYPPALHDMPDPPAVLHVAGAAGLTPGPAAAVVGARRATPYGLEVARMLGRGLGAAGVTVVSGMALGVDSAAHEGALEAGGPTVAVLAGGADVPYPPSKRRLYRRVLAGGCAVSELPPGFRPRRWCFPARNRMIAALSRLTVVVEAAECSGALITARLARELGREVGAVPGPITSPRARGVNDLLFDGAHVVRDAQDVLDVLFGVGGRARPPTRGTASSRPCAAYSTRLPAAATPSGRWPKPRPKRRRRSSPCRSSSCSGMSVACPGAATWPWPERDVASLTCGRSCTDRDAHRGC